MAQDHSPPTAVPDDGATAVVPDAARTEAAELAWSEVVEAEDHPVMASWRDAWSIAGVLLAIGCVAALVVAVVAWVHVRHEEPGVPINRSFGDNISNPYTSSQLTPWLPTPPLSTTTTTSHLPSKDELFVQTLERGGDIEYAVSKAVPAAQWVCAGLGAGRTVAALTEQSREGANSWLSEAQAADFVQQSIHFYCPQFQDE